MSEVIKVEVEEQNSEIPMDSDKRKKRRSSFFSKSKIATNQTTLMLEDEENNQHNGNKSYDAAFEEDRERSWKTIYLQKLQKESEEWDNLLWDMKSKYSDAVQMSQMPPQKLDTFLPPDFLSEEEKEFLLAGKKIYMECAQKLDELTETVAIFERKHKRYLLEMGVKLSLEESEVKQRKRKLCEELHEESDHDIQDFDISDSAPVVLINKKQKI